MVRPKYEPPRREPGFRLTGRNDGPEGIGAIHDGGSYNLGERLPDIFSTKTIGQTAQVN